MDTRPDSTETGEWEERNEIEKYADPGKVARIANFSLPKPYGAH